MTRRRAVIEHVRRELQVSERRACSALGQHRSTQRKTPKGRDDEAELTADIVELARQYGRAACPGLDPGATAKSRSCFGRVLAGSSTTSGLNGSGDKRG